MPCLFLCQQLLTKFEEWVDKEEGGGAVVGYDGFAANASVRGLLDSLGEEVTPTLYYDS